MERLGRWHEPRRYTQRMHQRSIGKSLQVYVGLIDWMDKVFSLTSSDR